MVTKNRIRPKIAHFGAFDHNSYGDLIFPYVIEHFLPEFEFIHVSPSGKTTPWSDAKRTISISQAFEIDDWDGIVVGGGDIVQADEGFIWNDSALQSLGALTSLWSGASLLSAKLNIPCAWNSPGVMVKFSCKEFKPHFLIPFFSGQVSYNPKKNVIVCNCKNEDIAQLPV